MFNFNSEPLNPKTESNTLLNFNLDPNNSTSAQPVKQISKKQQYENNIFNLASLLSEYPKGYLYDICKGITWYMFKTGTKRISREALSMFANNCHLNSVSRLNTIINNIGLFQVTRIKTPFGRNEINRYDTEFLFELAEIFGYYFKYSLSSVRPNSYLLDNYNNNNIKNNQKGDCDNQFTESQPSEEERLKFREQLLENLFS